jgi:hypothetical protein
MTKITENTREYSEANSAIDADERLSEKGKEERRKAARQEFSCKGEELWSEKEAAEVAELKRLQARAYKTSYPSHVITPLDRERYDQNVRTTRLALRSHSNEALLDELERSLTERDRLMSEAVYKEALHRSAGSANFSESLGVSSGAKRVVDRFHEAHPERKKAYEAWRLARARRDDPARMLLEGMHRMAGPNKEAGDTIGDGSAFLSDLLGGRGA